MNASNDKDASSGKIQIIKMPNRLKDRLGPKFKDQEDGFLAPEIIAQADQIIADLCLNCPSEIGSVLEKLNAAWLKIKHMPPSSPVPHEQMSEMFTLAHEIKDVGSMCGFALIAHFAESLRDYISHTQLNMDARFIIIQAHLDAIDIVHRKGFRQDAGPEAEELKRMVKRAIDKYK